MPTIEATGDGLSRFDATIIAIRAIGATITTGMDTAPIIEIGGAPVTATITIPAETIPALTMTATVTTPVIAREASM